MFIVADTIYAWKLDFLSLEPNIVSHFPQSDVLILLTFEDMSPEYPSQNNHGLLGSHVFK